MGLKDDVKEWSNAKKAMTLIVICCAGIIILFTLFGTTTPDANTNNDVPLQVKIISDGSWSGTIETTAESASYDGSGNKTIALNGTSFETVSASIQKTDEGSGELTVQILKDGKVVREGTTISEYGVVTVSE